MARRQDQGPDFELRTRAQPEQLRIVRHELGSWLDGRGTAPELRTEIALAVHEAAANVVEHAYPDGGGDLLVRARTNDSRVTVIVEDGGEWRPPSRTDQRGRGLTLMHGLMDDVEITSAEDGSGTRVTLQRRVDAGSHDASAAGHHGGVSKRLDRYRAKRDFEATPEPAGDAGDGEPGGRFVIHEHHARRLHWDLRLEHDGVLLSFAVPRGIPPDPKRNNLAVHTEDHPLEYLDFAGDIPKGEYGAGTMGIWDRGHYDAEKIRDDELIVTLHGDRVRGRYALFQTDGDNWMIHRMDPPEDPEREPMPQHTEPMLATLSSDLPRDEDHYAFEVKWDGVRAIAYVDGGRARFESRRGGDITSRYPELRGLGPALGSTAAVFDGEIVAFEGERPSFERLQRRMHVGNQRAIRRLMGEVPVVYVIFDLLWLEGHSTAELPYRDRRKLLDELAPEGESWQTPAAREGDGTALLDATKRLGLEGVVAKRLDSMYEPGRRSRAWVKVKNQNSQEFVIGGWLPGKGARSSSLGALLIGYYESTEPDARLWYAGRVGTGLTESELRRLVELLEPLGRDTSPFTPAPRVNDATFVEPELVAEVRFTEWTRAGVVRAPAYLSLVEDRDPREVVREDVATAD